MSETKKCRKCLIELPVVNFHVYSQAPDGRRNVCRQCLKLDAQNGRDSYIGDELKTCKGCGYIKKITEFKKCDCNKSGYRALCLVCVSKIDKTNYETKYKKKPKPKVDKEILPEGMSRCSCCKQVLEYSKFKKDKQRDIGITYCCKDCINIKRKQKQQEIRHSPELFNQERKRRHKKPYVDKWAWDTMYHHASDGYECLFTREQLIGKAKNTPNCEYCGIKLSWAYDNKKNGLLSVSPTLENLNCTEYIDYKNMHIVCRDCNLAKGHKNLKVFMDWCKACYENLYKLHKEDLTPEALLILSLEVQKSRDSLPNTEYTVILPAS